jgi:deoxyadenosine/deoxycytidine kinase
MPHPACRGKEDAWNWKVTATLQSTGRSALARLLAKRLASLWDAQVVLEQPEENPFLADSTGNAGQHAFQTQVFFLLQRIRQLQAARSGVAGGALRRRFHAEKDMLSPG